MVALGAQHCRQIGGCVPVVPGLPVPRQGRRGIRQKPELFQSQLLFPCRKRKNVSMETKLQIIADIDFSAQTNTTENVFVALAVIDNELKRSQRAKKKQTKISDFFRR